MAGRALLLAGAPGTGKTALALGIAQVSSWVDVCRRECVCPLLKMVDLLRREMLKAMTTLSNITKK